MYNVLLKKISIGYKICFRKCTPLPLPNVTGWRANSALALRLSGRETQASGGGGLFAQHPTPDHACDSPKRAVNSKYITRVLKYESGVGTKSRHQTDFLC